MNRSVGEALYRALAGEEGRTLPQVKVHRLLALPVPIDSVGSATWGELERLSLRMLRAEGRDTALDPRIDDLVEGLYELLAGQA